MKKKNKKQQYKAKSQLLTLSPQDRKKVEEASEKRQKDFTEQQEKEKEITDGKA